MSLINFAGLASGIDSTSLISAMMEQSRKSRVVPLTERVTTLTDTSTSLSELKDLLEDLRTKAGRFRALNGSAISKTSTSSNESILTGAATNAATSATYSVTTTALSKNATFSFNDRFSSDSSVINSAIANGDPVADRIVTVSIGTGSEKEDVSIELTNSTTASQFVSTFNASSTKAQASLVNVGTSSTPSYAIVINSNNEGTDKGQIATTVGSAVTGSGAGAFTANTLSQATNSQFSVSGISGTITRSTRNVTDVVPGVNFNLQNTGTATLTITDDTSSTTATVQEYVDAYNSIVEYVRENNLITQEGEGNDIRNVFSPLANTQLDENILTSLRSAMSGSSVSGYTIATLADLGITTQRDGTLKLDINTLSSSITSDSTAARKILEKLGDTISSPSGTIATFTQFNGLIDISLNANKSSVSDYNNKIGDIEASLSKQQDSLKAQFARLESVIGNLTSQQTALAGLLK